MKTKETINPDLPFDLTIQPDWQATPFTISQLDYDTAMELKADYEAHVPMPTVSHVEAPQPAPAPKVEYVDFAELSGREIARKRLSARIYDVLHRSNMSDLLEQKIADDRNVAFATKLGILTVNETYCQKHQKAVAKLGRLAG